MQCIFAMHLRGKRDKWEVLKVLLLFLPDTSRTSRIQNKDYNDGSASIQSTVSTVYHNFHSGPLLCCCIRTWRLPVSRGFSGLSVYLCKHRSIHAFCNEFEVISLNVNRCTQNIYRYLQYIQLTTKTEFMANDKNMRVLVTYNNCIKDDEMLWGV